MISIHFMLTKGQRMHLSYKPQYFKWLYCSQSNVFTLDFFLLLLLSLLEIKIGLEQTATMENLSLNG